MTGHAPKVMAAMAYEARVLSAPGRARFERHMQGCGACRETLASVRALDALTADVRALEPPVVQWAPLEQRLATSHAYDSLVSDVRSLALPEIDYSKMELALGREARTETSRVGRRNLWPVFALAAAGILGILAVRSWPTASDLPVATAPSVSVPERALVAARITALSGTATATGLSGSPSSLELGSPVEEGTRLANEGEAHLRLANGTGIAVRPGTNLTLSKLREGRVEIDLGSGAIASAVHKLGEGDHYRIVAGAWTVEVRGTRFSVNRRGEDLSVTCDEGAVAVSRNGEAIAIVAAPAAWSSSSAFAADPMGSVVVPFGLERLEEATLHLPALGWVKSWQIGETRFGADDLRVRVPAGELSVAAFDAEGRSFETVVSVPIEGASIAERSLGRPRVAPMVARGELDPAVIAPVVRSGIRRMQRCQELIVARGGAAVVGRFALEVTVGRTGSVQDADLAAVNGTETPPSAFSECVLSEAKGWVFPAPEGGAVTFAQPLTFGTRSR